VKRVKPRAPVTVEPHEQQVALRMAVHYLRTNAKNDDSVESDDMLRSAAILEHIKDTPPRAPVTKKNQRWPVCGWCLQKLIQTAPNKWECSRCP